MEDFEKKNQKWNWIITEAIYWTSILLSVLLLVNSPKSKLVLIPMLGFLASFVWGYLFLFDSILWHPSKKIRLLTYIKIGLSLYLFFLFLLSRE